MLGILLVLLSLSYTAASLVDEPYCALRYKRLCQGKGRHVGCQFPLPGPGSSCQNYTQIKFTSDLKHFIVHYINKHRQRIASGNERVRGGARLPQPEIMMLVGWDRELAKLAQRLADQCRFVHDDCRATVRYPYAGQSVGEVRWRNSGDEKAATPSAQRALRRVLDAWWGERRRVYARQLVAPFRLTTKDMVWGHFSQLAVWTLRAVGCGAVRHGFEHTRMLLVCDFSHTNMLGQRTINPGPLAPCPDNTVRRVRSAYPLLCAPVKRPIPPEKYDDENIKSYDYAYEEDIEEDEQEETTKLARWTTRSRDTRRTVQKIFRTDYSISRDGFDRIIDAQSSTPYGLPIGNRKSTIRASDKFEREFEMGNNEHILKKHHQWETRLPDIGRTRAQNSGDYNAAIAKAENKLMVYYDDDDDDDDDDGGGDSEGKVEGEEKHTTRSDAITNQGLNSRHRWKQSQMRPKRPGANALLNKPPEKQLQRSSKASFMLDQDDLEQLFLDTGFNVNWKRHQR